MNLEELKKPFPKSEINWRVGSTTKDKKKGLALAYINSRAVMNRLDEVCGPENWERKHDFGNNGEILCSIGIKIDNEWVWKTDGAAQTNYEAEKGGLSDSFKRAAVNWGIGRYLYKLPQKWVKIDKYKNIEKPPKLPKWALPEIKLDGLHGDIKKQIMKDKNLKKIVAQYFKENNIKINNISDLKKLNNNQAEELYSKLVS